MQFVLRPCCVADTVFRIVGVQMMGMSFASIWAKLESTLRSQNWTAGDITDKVFALWEELVGPASVESLYGEGVHNALKLWLSGPEAYTVSHILGELSPRTPRPCVTPAALPLIWLARAILL